MPKNSVSDPITDQEIAFVHLLLSGTMSDRQAAEAAGLNPTTAAYTKSKPRVRQYMEEHRAAVKKQLVNKEAENLHQQDLARGQILDRLWELAKLNADATKGSIHGQVKALGMIAAIEGLLPNRTNDRRLSAAPAIKPDIYVAEWLRRRQAEATAPDESVTAVEAQPAPPEPEIPPKPANDAPLVNEDQSPATEGDSVAFPKDVSWAPNAIGPSLDAYSQETSPLRRPFAPWRPRFGRGR